MDVAEKVISIVEQEADIWGVSKNTRLEALDLDSLEFVELITKIESEFNVKIPDEKWQELETVGDLVRMVPA